jgi:hypothetical protein
LTPAVCKWRGRLVGQRLDGLYEPLPGVRRTITDENGRLGISKMMTGSGDITAVTTTSALVLV